MSFQQGLSGLNATSKQLDVIGNNISNASTVGFKMAQAQFADVYANSLSGAGGNSVGIGVKVQSVMQLFTQGNISSSNNPLDLAINGAGFFRMSTNGAITYSRNGQFSLDKNGFIVNAQGAQLTGYGADVNGALSTGAAVPLNINTSDIAPKQTDTVSAKLNLDSRLLAPGTVVSPPSVTPIPFSMTEPNSYNRQTSVSVFDSLGNSHVLQTFFVRVDNSPTGRTPPVTVPPTAAQWDIFAAVDGQLILGTEAAPAQTNAVGTINFDAFGKLIGAVTNFSATDPSAIAIEIPVSTGAVSPISAPTIKYDMTGTTQYGSEFSVNAVKQDGYTSGKLSKFNTSKDGTIVGSYTNGRTAVLGQVAMANFTNPNGLQSLGDNQWNETSSSGTALIGTPGSGSLGVLTSSATEDSNTDLTGELVNMITAQRVYQANAQTIKTQDQVLQTLVNLR
ncbi:flagellar hook protein FlgE [Undibacterium seohonense]|jgi:flagellar hook protein FlgE|uniref:Flagellar hook protein FlgE n=1 Tax=Undibacterium seohonense TaxID=1344950 RepID=A0ABR6X6T0_9BURK|nr:flagellar hook protein FlgE [Undibacterium seohonense]MBC3808669.1 flagellar hook protein FlgE [Undibacterium seohonense]